MPLSRPWIPLSRFLKPLQIAITLRCSDLILSPFSPRHPFLYSSYLYCQRILTLDQAEFVQNSNFHEAIQDTPFHLMHGFTPWTGKQEGSSEKSPGASEWKMKLEEARKRAQEALERAREAMKRHYDRKKEVGTEFEVGTQVWLDGRNLKTYRPGKKLDHKKLGPFTILEKIGKSAYRLRLPKSWNRIHPVFNEVLLSPYHPPNFASQAIPEPPGPIMQEGW